VVHRRFNLTEIERKKRMAENGRKMAEKKLVASIPKRLKTLKVPAKY